jgi:hypothetical protein
MGNITYLADTIPMMAVYTGCCGKQKRKPYNTSGVCSEFRQTSPWIAIVSQGLPMGEN